MGKPAGSAPAGFLFVDMNKEREQIYRRILYAGMVDIRNLSYRACSNESTASIENLTRTEYICCVAGLAEWLHDLALRAQNFTKWNEQNERAFKLNYETFRDAFPPEKYPVLVHQIVEQL